MATFESADGRPDGDRPDGDRPDDGPGNITGDVPDDLSELFSEPTPGFWRAGNYSLSDAERDDDLGSPASDLGSPASDLDDVLTVLDNPELVHARDPGRLLWALATAGAQVRRAIAANRPNDAADGSAPRAVLVVTDASASVTGAVLAHLGGGQAAVLDWRASELPRWAGPADALLAASTDGRHPRVAMLLAEADRRGLSVVAVSPDDSPVAAAAGRGTRVPIDPPAHRRAALWTMLTPLLLAARDLGAVTVTDDELIDVADSLDAVAAACRPDTDAFGNAAKQLAIEITESDLLVAGCGELSALAGRWMADSLALMAGIGAVALALPDDVAEAGALLEIPPSGPAASDTDDFYRDRSEVPTRRRRLLILPEYGVEESRSSAGPGLVSWPSDGSELYDLAASRAAGALDDIASARGIVSSRPELPGRSPLARFAAATAFGDFTAAYAGIGRGVDPGAVRAGEMPF
jgi:glucose/mannose-6-phosphate isomerase